PRLPRPRPSRVRRLEGDLGAVARASEKLFVQILTDSLEVAYNKSRLAGLLRPDRFSAGHASARIFLTPSNSWTVLALRPILQNPAPAISSARLRERDMRYQEHAHEPHEFAPSYALCVAIHIRFSIGLGNRPGHRHFRHDAGDNWQHSEWRLFP